MFSNTEPNNRIEQTPAVQPDKPRFTAADVIRAVDAYLPHGKLLLAAQMVMRSAPQHAEMVARHIKRNAPYDTPERRAALEALGFSGDRSNDLRKPYIPPVEQQQIITPDAASVAQPGNEGGVCRDELVPVDTETGRIFAALKKYEDIAYTFYAAMNLNQRTGGAGNVREKDLFAELQRLGMKISYRTFQRHLQKGEGVFYRSRHKGRVYLHSWIELSRIAVTMAVNADPYTVEKSEDGRRVYVELPGRTLVETNLPGKNPQVYISLRGTTAECNARLYAAWHSTIQAENISRFTMSALWNRSPKALVKWEAMAGIGVEKCYAIYTDGDRIPFHASPYLKTDGTIGAQARIPNIYTAPDMPKRTHYVKPQRVRHAAEMALEAVTPVCTSDSTMACNSGSNAGVGYLHTGKRYFRGQDGDTKKALNALKNHLRRDSDRDAHYICTEQEARNGGLLFEQISSSISLYSGAENRAPARAESDFFQSSGGRMMHSHWRLSGYVA